ncbi:DNA-directed RNA polymerase I subunit rpa43 [Mycena sanguinolenta]|uniref:DNA-directed RNA polymerase I subunit rpa43 n=1 Tax=Mycena sanguinolenta TaxID=230812 RepID=A0A8H7DJ07_9AGAR|nr:DNA-directed RNA polymerase I subunit rpa43 [Mycena sanguinolenta]
MSSASKKRKPVATADSGPQPHKKPKLAIQNGEKGKTKDKGKARESNAEAEFKTVTASLVVSVPPIFASNPYAGVQEMLGFHDNEVRTFPARPQRTLAKHSPRYIPALRGVVLAHSNLSFLKQTAAITADCPFLVCNIQFDATVWSPHVGMKLVGKINLCSPDHISLLLHRTFNVSIPRHHIPTDEWEFEHAPADADAAEANAASGDEAEPPNESEENEEEGRWVHKITGKRLGGKDGYLEFAVIGLTVANEMLSLVGSIQHDPFSPEHVAATPVAKKTVPAAKKVKPEEDGDDGSDDSDSEDSDTEKMEIESKQKKRKGK